MSRSIAILLLRILSFVHLLNLVWMTGLLIALAFAVIAFIGTKSRRYFGLYLYFLSYLIGFATWLGSAATVAYNLGFFWLIFGLIFAGIGVIPIALLDAILHHEWSTAWLFVLQIVLLFGARIIGITILSRTQTDSIASINVVSKWSTDQEEEA